MRACTIRCACEEDAAEIARLAGQLGYQTSSDTMRARLQRLLARPDDVIFVAESAEGGLLGWIHGVLSQFLESDYRVEIGGLIVDERSQRKGIGRELVKQIEKWASERGVRQTLVRCQTKRLEAHLFYESQGYARSKTQVVFRKSLTKRP